jgi:hypothetical protein
MFPQTLQRRNASLRALPNHTSDGDRFDAAPRVNWLASRKVRYALLAMAACWSLPCQFAVLPEMGIGYSWQLALQLAVMDGKIFGRDFVFTYGPLGYLLIRAPVNKAPLLLYDLYILCSLLCIYRDLLPRRPRPLDALVLIGLAFVTRTCLLLSPSAVLFTALCHWLWRTYVRGEQWAVAGSLIAAVVLFFGKVNYGLVALLLVPAYAIAILANPKRRIVGAELLLGLPALLWLGAVTWHVDLARYLRAGIELIAGYSEALAVSPGDSPYAGWSRWALAALFLLAACAIAFAGRRRLPWRDQAMLLPLLAAALLLLYKNAYTRADELHVSQYPAALPLLLAVWLIAWRGAAAVRRLLLASVVYAIALLTAKAVLTGPGEWIEQTPYYYLRQAISLTWHEDGAALADKLSSRYPEAWLPAEIRSRIGLSSVDVMPWEGSLAVVSHLNYRPRPIPQSYTSYTPQLDRLNALFLDSAKAPDYLLYLCGPLNSLDNCPAAWDDSQAKRALLENYSRDAEFELPIPSTIWPYGMAAKPATVFLLKRTPQRRRLAAVAKHEVTVALDQELPIPATANLLFLTLDVERSVPGQLKAAALSPDMLAVTCRYQDGSEASYRAVLPILKSGVLVNRRVESADEIRNWLQAAVDRNLDVSSIRFTASSPGAFKTPFRGQLVEYRLLQQ